MEGLRLFKGAADGAMQKRLVGFAAEQLDQGRAGCVGAHVCPRIGSSRWRPAHLTDWICDSQSLASCLAKRTSHHQESGQVSLPSYCELRPIPDGAHIVRPEAAGDSADPCLPCCRAAKES
eukprot:SAG11_NODE_2520_length_3263_cov_2.014223_2_plen_121_part_00